MTDYTVEIQGAVPTRAGLSLPPVIHSLWLQGEADWPDLVRLCFGRWAQLNPAYQLRVLDRAGAERLLADESLPIASLSAQSLSDVVRTKLLLTQGGIWVDATVLPTHRLDEWLPALIDSTGFFAFARPGPDRPLSSWFLASSPGHLLFERWWEQVKRFWSVPRDQASTPGDPPPLDPVATVAPETAETDSHPYFWFHYLFDYLIDRDPDVARVWSQCAQVSAEAPHRLQGLFAGAERPELRDVLAVALESPVHKLNWRADYPLELLASLPDGPESRRLLARVFRRRSAI